MNDSARKFRRAKELLSEDLVADIEKLKAKLNGSDTQTNLLQWQDQKLIVYEKALEFYADEDNWSTWHEVKGIGGCDVQSYAEKDRGKLAREALPPEVKS